MSTPTRSVRERAIDAPPALVHASWSSEHPWLVQGTTRRGIAPAPFDLSLFGGGADPASVESRWGDLLAHTGMVRAVHARQVHGAGVTAAGSGPAGLAVVEACDAHVTDTPGVLLAVTVADCVPVFLVDPERRAVGMVHAGWRGAAAGVVEAAVAAMADRFGTDPAALEVHLGPSICGACYEVGPEVFEALRQPVPERPRPIDLRAVLAGRVRALGVRGEAVTVSAHCTRCTGSGLFSHRAGDPERQVGFLGIRPTGEPTSS